MSRPKVLILDDDHDYLEVCQQMLAGLESEPEIQIADSGTLALALLESESFSLLLTDLRMPKMDGFQVLALVRKRLPHQRIAVMSALGDDQSRTRAYEVGIDLFLEKPKSSQERQFFLECIESLLEREHRPGFRGMLEHKGLVDIIQLECLTQSSAVVKIASGRSIGYIWFRDGNIIDAATATKKAEEAFKEILSWKVGSFDLMPPDPTRERTIATSTQGLLLDTAQALDEARSEDEAAPAGPDGRLRSLDRAREVEFLLHQEQAGDPVHWKCEDPQGVSAWARRMMQEYTALGEALGLGLPEQMIAGGTQRQLAIAPGGSELLVASFKPGTGLREVRTQFSRMQQQWVS